MLSVSPRSLVLFILCLLALPDIHFLILSITCCFVVASELFNVKGTPELRQDVLVGLAGALAGRVVRVTSLGFDMETFWAAPGAGCSGAV